MLTLCQFSSHLGLSRAPRCIAEQRGGWGNLIKRKPFSGIVEGRERTLAPGQRPLSGQIQFKQYSDLKPTLQPSRAQIRTTTTFITDDINNLFGFNKNIPKIILMNAKTPKIPT